MVDVLEVDMVRQVFSQQETSLDRDQRLGKREEILSDLTQTLFEKGRTLDRDMVRLEP